jgi:hypothetical protein
MAITVSEKWDSREGTSGDGASTDLRYIIRGTDDDTAARDALVANSPAFYNLLIRQSAHIARIGEDTWEGTVRYGTSSPPQTGQSSFSFDTGGGSQHITQGRGTVARYAAPGKNAPNFGGAIGVTQDNVEGVDIYVPVYNFSETHHIDPANVTGAYKSTLFFLTACVNSDGFKGFAPGEVLFLGASGTQRGQEDWEITFKFAASPNATGLVIGEITGINKKGWEYLWVRYADAEDTTAKVLVKKPIAVYVEQVYPMAAFAGLGIGS